MKSSVIVEKYENPTNVPGNWDGTQFHSSLQALRMEPRCAHGFAPCQLLLGRKPRYPCEIAKTKLEVKWFVPTASNIQALESIRQETFGIGDEKIKTYQSRMKKTLIKGLKLIMKPN